MRRRANWKSTFSHRATPMPEFSAPATDEKRNERTEQAWEPVRQTASGCPTLRILRPHVPAGARRHRCDQFLPKRGPRRRAGQSATPSSSIGVRTNAGRRLACRRRTSERRRSPMACGAPTLGRHPAAPRLIGVGSQRRSEIPEDLPQTGDDDEDAPADLDARQTVRTLGLAIPTCEVVRRRPTDAEKRSSRLHRQRRMTRHPLTVQAQHSALLSGGLTRRKNTSDGEPSQKSSKIVSQLRSSRPQTARERAASHTKGAP